MKFKKSYLIIPVISTMLLACNPSGINRSNAPYIGSVTGNYDLVGIYKNRQELPKHTVFKGIAKAQNKNMVGDQVPPQEIMEELKKQAILLGGNGIVNVTPGVAQTTADVVFTR